MVLFRTIVTGFTETAHDISKEISLLPEDRWTEVQFESNSRGAKIPLLYIPRAHDPTTTFRDALNKSTV
jgi:hypothetical protein